MFTKSILVKHLDLFSKQVYTVSVNKLAHLKEKIMKKFVRTMTAAAVAAVMAPGFAADVAYDADIVVIGAGGAGTAAAWAAGNISLPKTPPP